MAVKIVTDSTSYIKKEWVEKFDIRIVSLFVSFGEESYREIDLTNEFFYSRLNEYGGFPKSSQPSVDDFYSTFEKILAEGDDLIGVFISSDMSGTFSTANLVKNMLLEKYPSRKIEIIDSRSNSMELGYSALVGARAAMEGKNFQEVFEIVKYNVGCGKFIFIPDTFDYLKMGGRIGNVASIIGTALQIKPILSVVNGKTDVLYKIRTRKKALIKMIEEFTNDIQRFGFGEAVVHHINCYDDGKKLADLLEERTGKKISVFSIGPVIGTHVGPGAIGIAYYTSEKMKK